MSIFVETEHPRSRAGAFVDKPQSAPQLTLASVDLRATEHQLRALRSRLEHEHPGLMLDFAADPGSITVRTIVVPADSRGAGTGSQVMRAITQEADREGWRLSLTPTDDYDADVDRLFEFYQRFGFRANTAGIGDDALLRHPKIPEPPLVDRGRLSPAAAVKLDAHLAETRPGTNQTNGSFYASLDVTHLAQEIVEVKRFAPPELRWRLHVADGEPVDVPAEVAKACTAEDRSEPGVALRHRRDRAHVAREKATEERSRRSGRTDGPTFGKLRAKEDSATARFLAADAEYSAATGAPTASAAADRLATWNSDELVGLRRSGRLTKV
jgi:GNAT superfamily N-acetyltransferase